MPNPIHSSRPTTNNLARQLMNRLNVLAAVVIVIFIAISLNRTTNLEQALADSQIADWSKELETDLHNALQNEEQGLRQVLISISALPAVKKALAEQDRDQLRADWSQVFDELDNSGLITHFSFISADRINLERLHSPGRHGDRIDRQTLLEAERTGTTASGLEQEPTGVVTFRVVQPVYQDKKRVGYVEFGQDLDAILVAGEHEYQHATLIRKTHIDRTAWETDVQRRGGTGDWGLLKDYATTALPPTIEADSLTDLLTQSGEATGALQCRHDDRNHIMLQRPLLLADGQMAGLLVVSRDITDFEHPVSRQLLLLMIETLLIAGALFVSMYWLSRYFFSQLENKEALLLKHEQALNEAQAIARVGSWELDLTTNHLTWSHEIFRIFEIDPDHFGASYEAFMDAIHPDDRDRVNEAYQHSLKNRQPYGIRHRLLLPGGRIKHVHEQCRTDFAADGKALRSIGTVQDITGQVASEIRLQRINSLLQDVINHVPLRIFWKDCELNYLGCNPPFAADAGLDSPDQLIGRNDYDMGWANEAEIYRADDRQIMQSGQPRLNYDEPQTTPDGNTIWLRTSKVPLKNLQGEVIGVLGIYQDITDEKAKDAELEQHRDSLEKLVDERTRQLTSAQLRYQQLVDELGEDFVVFSFTEDGVITYVSNGFETVFGIPKQDIIGKSWEQTIAWHPEDLQETTKQLKTLLDGQNDSVHSEVRFQRQDGKPCTVYQRSHATFDEQGNLVSVDGVLIDISSRKQAEAELRRAMQMAEAANQAKSAFLANMSHEIRTPMNGVIAMLEILSHSSLTTDQQDMLETMRRSSRSLLGVIEDILDFSKIEAGKLSIEQQAISLEKELDLVANLIDRIAMEKQVELTLFFDPRIPEKVEGDGLRLRQILTNLAGNAVKFSAGLNRTGRVQLRAELEQQEADNAWIVFKIIDNGVGMNAETMARLFQPFEQADNSSTRRFGGTGLGLSISSQLTHMMNGEISVSSEPEQGATFSLRLPFRTLSPCPNQDHTPYDLSGIDCLIVADEPAYQDDYSHYLTHAGAHPYPFSTLTAARDFIVSRPGPAPTCVVILEDPGYQSAKEIVERFRAMLTDDQLHLVEVACLTVERGKRRRVRRLADRIVQIDREALTRTRFLEAVAAAVGRIMVNANIPAADPRRPHIITGLRILAVDDNEINRDVIERQLQMLGYQAELAIDGTDALARWQQGHYDLILTDIHMPRMDGYKLTAAIRDIEARDHRQHTPIVALTANAMKGEEENCLQNGMDAYLAKPIELDRLGRELDHWLHVSRPVVDNAPPVLTHTGTRSEPPVFDDGALTRLVGDNPAMKKRLLTKFCDSLSTRSRDIINACLSSDAEEVRQTAHTLKSAARSVGAMQLGQICEQLEQAGKDNNSATIAGLTPEFEATWKEASNTIQAFLAAE